MKYLPALFVLATLTILSCKQKDGTVQQVSLAEDTVQTFETVAAATEEYKDTITYDTLELPREPIGDLNVLLTGTFHGDEVEENSHKKDWLGLFMGPQGYYLEKTKLRIIHAADPVLDDEGEQTGWEVTTDNMDTSIVLIKASKNLKEREIKSVAIKAYIYPGDTVSFNYLGIDYKLLATGGKRKVQESPEWYDVWNYKLYLTAVVNGETRTSLLVAHRNFDDNMTKIIFAGDIDGDNILDLIIDASRHYNAESPTVYFSTSAEKGEILKAVGQFTMVGC